MMYNCEHTWNLHQKNICEKFPRVHRALFSSMCVPPLSARQTIRTPRNSCILISRTEWNENKSSRIYKYYSLIKLTTNPSLFLPYLPAPAAKYVDVAALSLRYIYIIYVCYVILTQRGVVRRRKNMCKNKKNDVARLIKINFALKYNVRWSKNI